MKAYTTKIAALVLAAFISTGVAAQEDVAPATKQKKSEEIVVKPKEGKDVKVTIEIKDGKVTIDGKPVEEYDNDNVSITRRKNSTVTINGTRLNGMARSPFRGQAFSFNDYDDMAKLYEIDSKRPLLGVSTEKTGDGAIITEVTENSAAAKAGLKEDDIITKINDKAVDGPEKLSDVIGIYKPGDKVTVTYKRDKKEQKVEALLGKRKPGLTYSSSPGFYHNFDEKALDLAPLDKLDGFNFDFHGPDGNHFIFPGKARLGIKAQETEDSKGLKVLEVDDDSPAAKAGVKEGDLITSFDGTEVNNIEQLRELSGPAIKKNNFKIRITRDGKSQDIEIKIPRNLKTANL